MSHLALYLLGSPRIERNGKDEQLPGKFSQMQVHPGETVTFLTAGGGGYGAPQERDVAAVRRDVALGYLSQHSAQRNYPHAFPPERRETGIRP